MKIPPILIHLSISTSERERERERKEEKEEKEDRVRRIDGADRIVDATSIKER